eukprot:SAG31_NODE_532_length_14374_cov_30.565254_10_plen_72_part_00
MKPHEHKEIAYGLRSQKLVAQKLGVEVTYSVCMIIVVSVPKNHESLGAYHAIRTKKLRGSGIEFTMPTSAK